jgi:hypothetical protein
MGLKRLLCRHEFDLISNVWTTDALNARFRCVKCGKEEGLASNRTLALCVVLFIVCMTAVVLL